MQKASLLTRIRFSYGFALLQIALDSLPGRLHRQAAEVKEPGRLRTTSPNGFLKSA